jgi:hypothetical protein
MSLELDKKIMELFTEDQEATYRTSYVDSEENAWSLPRKLKNYVIGTFYEDKSLSLCEITMKDGRAIILKA